MAAYSINGLQEGCSIEYQFQQECAPLVKYPLINEIASKTGLQKSDPALAEYTGPEFQEIRSVALGYGGMTTEEKESAILQKYAAKDTVMQIRDMRFCTKFSQQSSFCVKRGIKTSIDLVFTRINNFSVFDQHCSK